MADRLVRGEGSECRLGLVKGSSSEAEDSTRTLKFVEGTGRRRVVMRAIIRTVHRGRLLLLELLVLLNVVEIGR